jgi:hypothetical protein
MGLALLRAKRSKMGMNYWRGQPISTFPPLEVKRAANETINELIGLRELHSKRENFEMLVLTFVFGTAFSGLVMIMGMLLHR